MKMVEQTKTARRINLSTIRKSNGVEQLDATLRRSLEQYHKIRKPNLHKMNPIPIYKKEV